MYIHIYAGPNYLNFVGFGYCDIITLWVILHIFVNCVQDDFCDREELKS